MVRSRFPMIARELTPRVQAALKGSAELMARGAQATVPVDHGDLRDAIHVEQGDGGFYVIAGDESAFYGHMVEYGTSHSPPHPFLIPAFEAGKAEAIGLVVKALRGLE